MALWIMWSDTTRVRMACAVHHHTREDAKLMRSVEPERRPPDRMMRTVVDAKATFPRSEGDRVDGGSLIATLNTLSDQQTKKSTVGIFIGVLILAALAAMVFAWFKHKRQNTKTVKEPQEVGSEKLAENDWNGWDEKDWAGWNEHDWAGWSQEEEPTQQTYEVVDDTEESIPKEKSTTSGASKRSEFLSLVGAPITELQDNSQIVLEVLVANAKKLPVMGKNSQTNALCKVAVYNDNPLKMPSHDRKAARITDVLETHVKENRLDPKWGRHFLFNITYTPTCHLYVGVYDRKKDAADELFAETSVLVRDVVAQANYHELLLHNPQESSSSEKDLQKSRLYVKSVFTQASTANSIKIQLQRGRKLPSVNPDGGIDAYMVIRASRTDFVANQELDPPADKILSEGQSSVVSSKDPVWNTNINMSIPSWRSAYVTAILYSNSTSGPIAVGWFSLKLERLINERLNTRARSYKLKNVPGSTPFDLKNSTITLACHVTADDLPEP